MHHDEIRVRHAKVGRDRIRHAYALVTLCGLNPRSASSKGIEEARRASQREVPTDNEAKTQPARTKRESPRVFFLLC